MKAIPILTAIGVAGTVAVFTLPTFADAKKDLDDKSKVTSRISSEISVTPKTKELTAEEKRNLNLVAGRLLKHTSKATTALSAKDIDSARKNIDQALTLVQIADQVRPVREVKATIKAGDIVYEDNDDVRDAYIPIYEELDRSTLIAPILKQKSEGNVTSPNTEEGQKETKPESSETRAAEKPKLDPAFVAEPEIQYTSTKLNVTWAATALELAKGALQEDSDENIKEAQAALNAVWDGVVYRYVEIDLPLQKARLNLGLAKSQAEQGRKEAALISLEVARKALGVFQATASDEQVKEVKSLSKEIDKLTKDIAGTSDEDFVDQLGKWWDKVGSWFSKEA